MCCTTVHFPTRTKFAQGERTQYTIHLPRGMGYGDMPRYKRESRICNVVPARLTITRQEDHRRPEVEHIPPSVLLAGVNYYDTRDQSRWKHSAFSLAQPSTHKKEGASKYGCRCPPPDTPRVRACTHNRAILASYPRKSTQTSTMILTALCNTTATAIY